MIDQAKPVRLQHRGTKGFHDVTPATWKKMQAQGKGESYKEVSAPSVPKEVAAKVAQNKMAVTKPASDQHHDSTTNTAEHPG